MMEVLLFALGVLATVGVGYHFRPKRALPKMLTVWASQNPLVSVGDEVSNEIKITYNGKVIEGISRVEVSLWNSGGEIIRGDEISELDPINISYSQELVVSTPKISQSRKSVGTALKLEQDRVRIDFDILDLNDWARIEFLVDKLAQPGEQVAINGVVAGIPDGIQKMDSREFLERFYLGDRRDNEIRKYTVELIFFAIATAVMAAAAFYEPVFSSFDWPYRAIPAVFAAFLALINAWAIYRETKNIKPSEKFRAPPFLKDYEGEIG